jgi:hypothetical protein
VTLLSRRTFALLPVALAAQGLRPGLIWVWCEGEDLPLGVRGQAIVFPRCYVADGRSDEARHASETGRFAHASSEDDATLGSILKQAGISYREITLEPDASAVALLKPRVADNLLVSQVDLMPTLAALCGIAAPAEAQGRNLAPLLRGEAGEPPDSVYVEGSTWRVVIRGYQKLVTDLTGTPVRLYNLAADPGEQNDLMRDPSSRLTLDGLLALTQVWMRRLGDRLDPSGLKRR